MKKNFYLAIGIVMMLMTNLVVMSCGSDDEPVTRQNSSAPYGKWTLLGYVSNGNFVSYENSEAKDCYLLLEEDGSYRGQFCNLLKGEYSFSQNGEFRFLDGISTAVLSTDADLMFMEEQIGKVRSFEIDGNVLKLYYSLDDYLKFSPSESSTEKPSDEPASDPVVVVPKTRADVNLTAEGGRINDAVNQFSLKLFKEMYLHQDNRPAMIVSPFSAQAAITMAANGARGATLDEMLAVMNLKGFGIEDINLYNQTIIKALTDLDNTSYVESANGIWSGMKMLDSYIDDMKNVFDADVRTTDFSKDEIKAINDWAYEKTHGMIPSLFDEDKGVDAQVVLANALYFNAVWESPFSSENNIAGNFANADKSWSRVVLMKEGGYKKYLRCESFDLCEKQYGNGAFSMVFLLPHDQVTLEGSISNLCQMNWAELNKQLKKNSQLVQLSVPKFDLKGMDYDLKPTLQDMGMQIPFTGLADFSNMCKDVALAISKVNQKTALMLNEQGTQAAAITKVEFIATDNAESSKPIIFTLNRPFAFLIKENSTGCILFTGAIDKL